MANEQSEPQIIERHLGYATYDQVREYVTSYPGERCWRCRFFDPVEDVTADESIFDGKSTITCTIEGMCRRNPPVCHSWSEDITDNGVWPFVRGYDWCGEFKDSGITAADICFYSDGDPTTPQNADGGE